MLFLISPFHLYSLSPPYWKPMTHSQKGFHWIWQVICRTLVSFQGYHGVERLGWELKSLWEDKIQEAAPQSMIPPPISAVLWLFHYCGPSKSLPSACDYNITRNWGCTKQLFLLLISFFFSAKMPATVSHSPRWCISLLVIISIDLVLMNKMAKLPYL